MSLLRPTLLRKVLFQPKRTKFHSRKLRDPHFDRKKMLEVCKPILDTPVVPSWKTCPLNTVLPTAIEAHPYEKILAEELKNNWFSSRMICFFHINPIPDRELTTVRNTFTKKGLFFHTYSTEVVKLAILNTRFRSCLHLFKSSTAMVFGANPDVKVVLKIEKNLQNVILLAAFVDNVFLSRNQLMEYSKLSGLEVLHQQLSCVLSSQAANLSQNISYPTQMLSRYLKQLSEGETQG